MTQQKYISLQNICLTSNETPKNEGIGTQTNSENINPQLSKAKKLERSKDYHPIQKKKARTPNEPSKSKFT